MESIVWVHCSFKVSVNSNLTSIFRDILLVGVHVFLFVFSAKFSFRFTFGPAMLSCNFLSLSNEHFFTNFPLVFLVCPMLYDNGWLKLHLCRLYPLAVVLAKTLLE